MGEHLQITNRLLRRVCSNSVLYFGASASQRHKPIGVEESAQTALFRTLWSRLAAQGRYNLNRFLGVLRRSLQGVAERPLPCNYHVIQPISALSRSKRGFKSRRGRQFNGLQENRLLSV